MRNRLYGGARGQVNTKVGDKHLRLVFTSYSISGFYYYLRRIAKVAELNS